MCCADCGRVWLPRAMRRRRRPDSPTGLPRRQSAPMQGCENFGRYWTDTSGAMIDPVPLELFTNCRIEDDGTWAAGRIHVRRGATRRIDPDRRPAGPARAASYRHLGQQIDGLEATLPKSVQNAFDQLHTDRATMRSSGISRKGSVWGSYRTRYARIVNAYMLDPQQCRAGELSSAGSWRARSMAMPNFRRSVSTTTTSTCCTIRLQGNGRQPQHSLCPVALGFARSGSARYLVLRNRRETDANQG